jgi:RNA-directed DNA polymerase
VRGERRLLLRSVDSESQSHAIEALGGEAQDIQEPSRGLVTVAQWCRINRHQALAAQQYTLGQKLRGHFAYYGITGNAHALSQFRWGVIGLWRKWLGRRHRGGEVAWERMYRLLERYPLPAAIVVHSVYRRAAKV